MTTKKAGIAPGLVPSPVMPGLVPGIHVLLSFFVVDGRVKPGHDDGGIPYCNDARLGGEAGHDLISVS